MATQLLSMLFIVATATLTGGLLADAQKELRTKEEDQERTIQLGRPLQINTIDPSRVVQLSWRPRVFLYRGFLTEEECDHLISRDGEVIAKVEERISAWIFLPKDYGKPLQLLHFVAKDTKEKRDYFGNISTLQLDEHVIATVLLYLSNVTRGGEIRFPKSEDKVWSDCMQSSQNLRPSKGNAIVFFSLHLDATPDGMSSHEICPVIAGEMWYATKVFSLNPVAHREKDSWQYGDTDCTDEDENCPHWAATGECKRNPIFMVGSDDYYGTCRKSCNAC